MTTKKDNRPAKAALERLEEASEFLNTVWEASRDATDELTSSSRRFLSLVHVAQTAEQENAILSECERQELLDLIERSVLALRRVIDGTPGAAEQLIEVSTEVHNRWGETLELAIGETSGKGLDGDYAGRNDVDDFDAWDVHSGDNLGSAVDLTTDEMATEVDIDRLLHELRRTADSVSNDVQQSEGSDLSASGPLPASTSSANSRRILDDPEMADAYLDDAVRCVASMEQSLLAYESDTTNREALNQVCRELHTLKGASASVELNELAAFLHDVEDSIRLGCDPGSSAPDPNSILQSIDKVRAQINVISGAGAKAVEASHAVTESVASTPSPQFEQSTSQEPTLRVKAAQVDRLMDMLAELVMLRNRRDSRVEQMKNLQNELLGCSSRVRGLDNGYSPNAGPRELNEKELRLSTRSNSFTEIADDIFAASDQLRRISQPLDAETLAISQFIRQFRQELVEIRRVPAEGLFRRLHRAVRDAAKVEGKEVRIEQVGEQTGIDRALQESLYDPLLHVVRNAVSHGIESPRDRIAAGKDGVGVVTLEARGGANFLVAEVRDDGRGLDYDALRRRGLERNLIKSDQPATESELAQLIFHPGFSTQTTATEISGRGVGMDVVASAIERLRGWIEIESAPGQGCRLRITVPLESTIEHAMLFRDGQQVFAIPMRFVHTVNTGIRQHDEASEFDAKSAATFQVAFRCLFNCEAKLSANKPQATLVVGFGADLSKAESHPLIGRSIRVALNVDEIVGPEEVVMRPLPGLLRNQRSFSGVSLAGSGEIVLALDTQQLLERCVRMVGQQDERPNSPADSVEIARRESVTPKALVVDDSATARRAMVNMLEQRGFAVVETMNGAEGLQALKSDNFNLLVSDLEMPRMDGLELIQEVRTTPALESLTAILSSSRDDEAFQTRAEELGVAAYLVKPVAEEQLDAVLMDYSFGQRAIQE